MNFLRVMLLVVMKDSFVICPPFYIVRAAKEKIAFHDHLTGLPNRLVLMDRIGQAVAYSDRGGKGFALCFMDLDGFKSINDTHGHHIGDVVLKEVAARLKDGLRASDTVARIGGDDDGCEILLDRLSKSVSESIRLRSGKLLHVGLSIGVTTHPKDANPVADLLKHADRAMYQAKKSKEDKFVLYQA